MERRAPLGAQEDGPWARFPHSLLYPLLGALLGALTPLGAFTLRYLQAEPVLKGLWARSELSYNAVFYVYMTVGSTFTFVLFGYFLGTLSESQRVRNRTLRERVEDLRLKSVTDGLTGAYSHAYLQEILALELASARQQESPLSVLMMNLDNFKSINDTQGHLFGDRVLKEITETVQANIRAEDVLGRYGGEEFLVVMPGADAEVSAKIAERIRQSIARVSIGEENGNPGLRATVSIGIATYGGGGKPDPVRLVDQADRNLYAAKRSGKNRVVA